MVLPAGLSPLGGALSEGGSLCRTHQVSFPVPCFDALSCRMPGDRGRKTILKCAPVPLWGADPVPIPYNKAPLTRVWLARPRTPSHNGAVIPS